MESSEDPSASRAFIVLARVATALVLLFLVLLILLHFLEPEFDPSWRMISEYELGQFGWMMRLAFFAWGASILLLTSALWRSLRKTSGRIGSWWMLLIGVVIIGAGIFKTNPITGAAANLDNTLHTICGGITILTFPIASSLVGRSLRRTNEPLKRLILVMALLVWIGMVSYFGSIIISVAINPAAAKGGPEVYQGWPNRFMVATYAAWIVIVGQRFSAIARKATVARPFSSG